MSIEAEVRPAPRVTRRVLGLFGLVVACVVAVDQLTKALAVSVFAEHPIDLGVVSLVLIRNPNAAFGIPGFPGLFLLVTLVVTVLVVRSLPRSPGPWVTFAYGMVIGGALGNAIDRVFRPPGFPSGAVVDWIYPGWFPAFNIADSAITVGAALLVLLLARAEARETG
jgi:signal peptidase II